MENPRKRRSFFWPLFLISIGVLIFLVNMGIVEGTTWDNLLLYWPVLLIIWGFDGLITGDGWVGPVVLLGLGAVLLLGNLNYLPIDAWGLLLRLWPVLLVAIGLDIAFGKRRSAVYTLLKIFLGLLLVGGIVWVAMSSPQAIAMQQVKIDQPLENAASAQTTLQLTTGKLSVEGDAPSSILAKGTVVVPKKDDLDVSYDVNAADKKGFFVVDGRKGSSVPFINSASPWVFNLNSGIPTVLTTSQVVGDLKLDLTGMDITRLESETVIGRVILTLPCDEDMIANLKVVIGDVELRIPQGCNMQVNLDGGLTTVSLPEDYLKVDDRIVYQGAGSSGSALPIDIELAIGRLVITEIN